MCSYVLYILIHSHRHYRTVLKPRASPCSFPPVLLSAVTTTLLYYCTTLDILYCPVRSLVDPVTYDTHHNVIPGWLFQQESALKTSTVQYRIEGLGFI